MLTGTLAGDFEIDGIVCHDSMLNAKEEVDRLISERPGSHRPGTFPRYYLPKGEGVLFESKPSLWGYLPAAIYVGLLMFLLAFILWNSPGLFGAVLPAPLSNLWQWLAILVLLCAAVGIASILVQWYFTSYALTNRRLVKKTGVYSRTIVDARFERIQAVTLTEAQGSRARGYGTLLFSLSTTPAASGVFSGIQHGGILWRAIPEPFAVRSFVEDVSTTFERLTRAGVHVELEE